MDSGMKLHIYVLFFFLENDYTRFLMMLLFCFRRRKTHHQFLTPQPVVSSLTLIPLFLPMGSNFDKTAPTTMLTFSRGTVQALVESYRALELGGRQTLCLVSLRYPQGVRLCAPYFTSRPHGILRAYKSNMQRNELQRHGRTWTNTIPVFGNKIQEKFFGKFQDALYGKIPGAILRKNSREDSPENSRHNSSEKWTIAHRTGRADWLCKASLSDSDRLRVQRQTNGGY